MQRLPFIDCHGEICGHFKYSLENFVPIFIGNLITLLALKCIKKALFLRLKTFA